mmetsp:Transcript_19684/g.46545  ORF Transcript_19684/g.46545 Transcript_19684/m.46545 type:complete len:207 (-) Transcript_19684:94-714(-)
MSLPIMAAALTAPGGAPPPPWAWLPMGIPPPPPPPPIIMSCSDCIPLPSSSRRRTELASLLGSVSRMMPPSQCSSMRRKTSSRLSRTMVRSVAPPMRWDRAPYMPSARWARTNSDSFGGPTWTTRTSPCPPPPWGLVPPQNTHVRPLTVTTSAASGRAAMPTTLDWTLRSNAARRSSTVVLFDLVSSDEAATVRDEADAREVRKSP